VLDELVPRVIGSPLADHGESLAGGPSDDDGDGRRLSAADVGPADLGRVGTQSRALREIESVRSRMDRIDLDCRNDIESGLLEP